MSRERPHHGAVHGSQLVSVTEVVSAALVVAAVVMTVLRWREEGRRAAHRARMRRAALARTNVGEIDTSQHTPSR